MRTSGTDSDFEVSLRESVHLSDARVRVDKLTFTDSFLTTDAGRHLYFRAEGGGFTSFSIPEGAYTGFGLAGSIQFATGRTTTYDSLTNSITHTLASSEQRWLADSELAAEPGSFPPGASLSDPPVLFRRAGEWRSQRNDRRMAFCPNVPVARVVPKELEVEMRKSPRAARHA